MANEPTIQDVLNAMQNFSTDILETIHDLSSHMDEQLKNIRVENRQLDAETRDFVDRRISDAVAEIVPVVRKIDAKDSALVTILEEQAVISPQKAESIAALSPFPTT